MVGQCSKPMAAQLLVRRWLCGGRAARAGRCSFQVWGRAGHPFIFGYGRNEGAGVRTLFRPRVGQEGNSPAGHTSVERRR